MVGLHERTSPSTASFAHRSYALTLPMCCCLACRLHMPPEARLPAALGVLSVVCVATAVTAAGASARASAALADGGGSAALDLARPARVSGAPKLHKPQNRQQRRESLVGVGQEASGRRSLANDSGRRSLGKDTKPLGIRALRLLRKEQPYAEEPDGWLSEERAPAHPHKAGAAAPPNATAIRDAVAHAIGQIERRYRAQPRHAARDRRGADGAKRTVEHF